MIIYTIYYAGANAKDELNIKKKINPTEKTVSFFEAKKNKFTFRSIILNKSVTKHQFYRHTHSVKKRIKINTC